MNTNKTPSLDRKLKEFPWLWRILDEWCEENVEVKVTDFPTLSVTFEVQTLTNFYVFATDGHKKQFKYLDGKGRSRGSNEYGLGNLLVGALYDQGSNWQKRNLKYFCVHEKLPHKKHRFTIFRPNKLWRDYHELLTKQGFLFLPKDSNFPNREWR